MEREARNEISVSIFGEGDEELKAEDIENRLKGLFVIKSINVSKRDVIDYRKFKKGLFDKPGQDSE